MKRAHKIITVFLATFLIVIIIAAKVKKSEVDVVVNKNPPVTNAQEKTKRYTSKNMRITVFLPQGYMVSEKFGALTISAPIGEIHIDRNATNFESLDEYLNDLSEMNRFTLSNKKTLVLSGFQAISGNVDDEKLYFIYKEGFVYTLSTSNASLFTDLDQIAQSFRYTP